MKSYSISKSSFIKGMQCEKQLYLYKNHYNLRDKISEVQQAIFSRGTNVGILAQNLLPGGTNLTPASPSLYEKAATITSEKLKSGEKVLYEPSFVYDGLLVVVDILQREGNKWNMFEVKSSTSVSDTYILDAAVQYYALKNSGLEIKDVSIIFVNNQYIRKGSLEINKLFKFQSVLNEVVELQNTIKEKLKRFFTVLQSQKIPDIDIGPHCHNPYDCSFLGYCWRKIPDYSVFDISGLSIEKKFQLYKEGIIKIDDVPEDFELSELQRIQVDYHKSGKIFIDKEKLREFVNEIKYPLYFMDFETFTPAVPLYDNSRPYQHILFQFALYFQKNSTSEPEYFEFLADPKEDPRIKFIKNLIDNTRRKGNIIVYNKNFEQTRLEEMARDFPEYEKEIADLISRLKDLMIPFQKKYFYNPRMEGSYSIKNVLPALAPDLSYSGLDIADGNMAMLAFESLLYETNPTKIRKIRNDLLKYCKLDSFGMIRIWQELENVLK